MFLSDQKIEATVLLQGDIVRDVPIVGTLELEKILEINATSWAYPLSLKKQHCAIISHSCEIAAENKEKVTSCILAPIRRADGATTDAQFEDLKASNNLKPGEPNFLKYFYLEPHEKLEGHPRGSIIDFSKLFSVRKSSIQYLIDRKILQMEPSASQQFARKAGAYFYRP